MESSLKEDKASCRALFQAGSNSFSDQTDLIPLPPPPDEAFNITGYPIFLAIFNAFL